MMKQSLEQSAVLKVLRRWMPEIRRAASVRGEGPDALLERVLESGLPKVDEAGLRKMLADAEASGFEPVDDLDRWQAKREQALQKRLAGNRL